jgi:hypothetical protein
MDSRIGEMLEGPGVQELSQKVFEIRKEPKAWRSRFLTIIRDMYPAALLWSRESFVDSDFEPVPAMPDCWRISAYNDVDELLSQLYQGGWGLFFGEEDALFAESAPLEYLPTEIESIESLLDSTGAKALILSWYDDNEWTVAIRC